MKRILPWFSIFLFLFSCDRFPDPDVTLLRSFVFNFNINQGERYFEGDWVGDSVAFHVEDFANHRNNGITVNFAVMKGGGDITNVSGVTDANGTVHTRWKLGSDSFQQILRATTLDSAGNFLNYSDLLVYGFRQNEWDTLSAFNEAGITSLAADTINHITLMTSAGSLYRQGNRYFDWIQSQDQSGYSVRAVFIDHNQVFYLNMFNGDLLKSTDHGASWIRCQRPFPDSITYQVLIVSNDNWLWAYGFNNKTRYSKDQGETWTDVTKGFTYYGYGSVYRLSDGSHLLQGESCCSLYRTFDDGITWTEIPAPGRPLNLFVTENDNIYFASQQGGLYIYKSTDYGQTFTYQYAVSPTRMPISGNMFNKWGKFYYVCIQGWGILRSSDLEHYEVFWQNPDLGEVFIDHNGVMIAKYSSWNNPYEKIVYYRKL